MSRPKNKKDKKRKRKGEEQPAPLKKPRLDEGTSHVQQATLQARKSLQRLVDVVRDGMAKHFNTYVYTPLRERFGEDIRVLIIEPGAEDDPISCRLVPSALGDARTTSRTGSYPFTALSYFWGEGEPIHDITITSYKRPDKKLKKLSTKRRAAIQFEKRKSWCPSGTVYVRSNLFVALKRFRHKRDVRMMWIDALCIDQDDKNERSAQVKKMHELYLHATNVCIWLGDGTGDNAPNPEDCFKFLKKMLDLKNLDCLLDQGTNDTSELVRNTANIVCLMCNKWFSRRWVLQELALARKAEVVYGKPTMSWADFADAIAVFIKSGDKISPILSKSYAENAVYLGDLSIAGDMKNLGANALVDFTNNIFRRSEHGDIQQRMMTLEVLVSSLLAFEAADPRDTIYAVLSLAKDTYCLSTNSNSNARYLNFDPRLSPDYKKKSLLDVYTDFIDYCIEKSRSLDILLRHWAPTWTKEKPTNPFSRRKISSAIGEIPNEDETLPSWIPLIQNSSHGTPAQRIRGRFNGDSFVGASHRTSHRNYSASLDLPPEYKFGFKNPDGSSSKTLKPTHDGHLSIKGLRIGTVTDLVHRASNGMIFREAFKLAGFDRDWWKLHKQWADGVPRVPEGFWRTIVADRGPNGSNPPSWYPRACMDCLNNLRDYGDLRPDDVISLQKAPRIAKDFLERVKDVIWERKFARVKLRAAGNTYGLMPAGTREADLICVLFGGSVPVVLRPQEKNGQEQFTMVGECFVYGMMEGEAVSSRSWEPPYDEAELFELI
ncbi:putative Heterokaryon incompatibility domain-containing protein [Seiridium cardinale]|uniref:Heterokaryon incompatibility domain-containing protein n=1 Tax=Seiridium cardinale TaxID=138064 RepID=A0ABR2XHP2_9PEZI